VKFYDNEGRTIEAREELEGGVPRFGIFIGTDLYEGCEYSTSRMKTDEKIMKLAKEKRWIPVAIQDAVNSKEKIGLQGEAYDTKTFIVLDQDEVLNAYRQYVSADIEITTLEDDLKVEVDGLKAECKAEVAKQQKIKDEYSEAVSNGTKVVHVMASWERSPDDELMFKVDNDTLAVLDVRDMTAEEKNPVLFDSTQEDVVEEEVDLDAVDEEQEFDYQEADVDAELDVANNEAEDLLPDDEGFEDETN